MAQRKTTAATTTNQTVTSDAAVTAAAAAGDAADAIASIALENAVAGFADATEAASDGLVEVTAKALTVSDAVRALIEALGKDEADLKAIEVRRSGTVRIFGTDHSARSVRIEPFSTVRAEKDAD